MSSRNRTKKIALTYGAALASLYAAPQLHADIVDLDVTPTVIPHGSTLTVTVSAVSAFYGRFRIENGFSIDLINNVQSFSLMQQTNASQTISASSLINGGGLGGMLSWSNSTGAQYVAFAINHSNAGWFKLDLGNPGDDIVLTGGQFATDNETLHVGFSIPEPSAATGLALLSLGALGVRRRKDVRQA